MQLAPAGNTVKGRGIHGQLVERFRDGRGQQVVHEEIRVGRVEPFRRARTRDECAGDLGGGNVGGE